MAKQANAAVPNQINMIGEGATLDGTLTAEGDVRISGRVVGTVEISGKVIVAQEGIVEGEVKATSLDVAGKIEGDIVVSERVVLKSSARIDGNIRTERLVVEEGAEFNGECRMGNRTVDSRTILSGSSNQKETQVRVPEESS